MDEDYITRHEFEAFQKLVLEMRKADKEILLMAQTYAKEAVDKADDANNRRLDLLNEFRQQSRDEQAHFLRAEVYQTQHSSLQKAVGSLNDKVASLEGRFLGLATVGALIGILISIFEFLRT